MPLNTLAYSQILQTKLDQQMIRGLVSGFMDNNAGEVVYNGGAEVKIPTISMQGLANYDRDKGFTQGSVTLAYQTKTMTQDRGRSFLLDAMDVNETNFIVNATAVASEFQRTRVIPEIDSYRFSKVFAEAKRASQVLEGYTPAEATILTKLTEHIAAVQDYVGEDVELVIVMSMITRNILSEAMKNNRRLNVGEFKKGEISLKVKTIDDIPILTTPSARLKTLYKVNDGKTPGQEAGGLEPDTQAKDINWLIMPKSVPIGVTKQDKFRIFDPNMNQSADAWKIDYRRYYDLWILDSKLKSLFGCTK